MNGKGIRIAIAAVGVLVSAGFVAAGVSAMPAGTEYGPSLSPASLACFAAFFVLNPLHLLLLVLTRLPLLNRLPLRGNWSGLVVIMVDLVWWWVASGALARFITRRRASPVSPVGDARN